VSYVGDVGPDAGDVNAVGFALTTGARDAFPRNVRQAYDLGGTYTCSGRLAPGGVVRSILKFLFVVVPTAALASAVVVAVSRTGQGATAAADGDLQRDLQLASSTAIELAPVGQALAAVSSIEAPPAAAPKRSLRPKRSTSGPRAVRSRRPVVRTAPEPEPAEGSDELEETEARELADGAAEGTAAAPDAGGVALPRPTGIPVSFPGEGADGRGDAGGGYDPGTVIRGGGVYGDDHCQIHGPRRGGRVSSPPIFRQPTAGIPTGGGMMGRVREAIRQRDAAAETSRSTILGRVGGRIRDRDGARTGDGRPRTMMGGLMRRARR
jgi:hypothetical protein